MNGRDTFIDPVTGATYAFHINHDAEETGQGRQRMIQATPVTGAVATPGGPVQRRRRFLKFQGDEQPLFLKWTGTILHRDQLVQMWKYVNLCDEQTILINDFFDEEAEVIVTNFDPQRVRAENKNDPAMPHHIYKYTLEMQIISIVSGVLADAGVVP